MSIHDLNAFAFKRLKARLDAGEVVELAASAPLLKAAEADPTLAVLDLHWLDQTFTSLPRRVQFATLITATDMACNCASGPTPQNVLHGVDILLREAERLGDLARWQRGDYGHTR